MPNLDGKSVVIGAIAAVVLMKWVLPKFAPTVAAKLA